MNTELRTKILLSRTSDYLGIMRTTIFTMLGIAVAVHFGADAYSAPLLTLTVAVTAFGILAGSVALDDIIALRDDMDDKMAATSYGGAVRARNLPTLRIVSAALLGLVGLAEVLAILI
jgi:hypothetical protein